MMNRDWPLAMEVFCQRLYEIGNDNHGLHRLEIKMSRSFARQFIKEAAEASFCVVRSGVGRYQAFGKHSQSISGAFCPLFKFEVEPLLGKSCSLWMRFRAPIETPWS